MHHTASEFRSQGAGQLPTQLVVIDQNKGEPRLAKDEPSALLQEMLGVDPGVRQGLATRGIDGERFIQLPFPQCCPHVGDNAGLFKFQIKPGVVSIAAEHQAGVIQQHPPQQLEWFEGGQLPAPLEQPVIQFSPLTPLRRVDAAEAVPRFRAGWHQLEQVTQGLPG